MTNKFLLLVLLLVYGNTAEYPFTNVTLTWEERVDDLVSRLTTKEIMYQMARGGGGVYGGPAPAIPRLGIKPYQWTSECLSGDVFAGNATSFPMSIGLAAAFSPDLIFRVSEATGVEVRAKHNYDVQHSDYKDHTGLSCFSPVINIMRHPLWGRNQETYGEDPFLSGVYASNYVKGLQGNNSRYIRANAGCKHFDAHGGPENIPADRMSFNSVVSERDWRLTFLPAFRQCVESGTYSLMCSYNSINGIPSCANQKLLTTILRDEWKFTGYVVSDMGAIENTILKHHYYTNPLDAVTGCVNAGCNLELSANMKMPVFMYMMEAVNKSLLLEKTMREKVKPLFYTRMRLGEFDPPSMNPYASLDPSDIVESDKHRKLAVEAAVKSFVLLKRQDSFLPFSRTIPRIAVVGPMANNSKQLFGDYSPNTDPMYISTPLDGLRKLALETTYASGCNDGNKCTNYSSDAIINAVQEKTVLFVCLGTGTDIESEGKDRSSMELPGNQVKLLQDAVQYGKYAPVVVLLFSAGPVNITWAEDNDLVAAIFQCFLPAQATGEALYTIMSYNSMNPAGKLPYTWYKDASQMPSMTNYSMTERTYRYFTGEPLYPFGYGLTYTTFQYSDLLVPSSVKAGDPVPVGVTVTNTGMFDGDEVVQVYISWLTTKVKMPNLQLVAFDRIFLPRDTGSSAKVNLIIAPHSMAVWTDDKGFVIEPGTIKVYVGGQQPNQNKTVNSNVLSTTFKITGFKHIK